MSRLFTPGLFLCSLAAGGMIFFFSLYHYPAPVSGTDQGRFGSYAALALDAEVPDRDAAEALERALGRPAVSASSQWVFLNSFEDLERVPLEEYEGRLESFDPRRDGYAEKLMNFFVRHGKRWFFIPLDSGFFGPLSFPDPGARLKKRVDAALAAVLPLPSASGSPPGGAESFLLRLEARSSPAVLRILLFVLAWGAALIFLVGRRPPGNRQESGPTGEESGLRRRFFRGAPSGVPAKRRRLLLLGPVMLPLSLWGAPGFAFLALFLSLGALFADPLKEWWVYLLKEDSPVNARRQIGSYRSWFLSGLPLILILPAALILYFSAVPPLLAFLNFLALSAIYCCSLGIEVRRKFPLRGKVLSGAPESRGGKFSYGSCRFVPLPILPRRLGFRASLKPDRRFGAGSLWEKRGGAGLILPFALASCLAALSSFLGRDVHAPRRLLPDWGPPVTEEDYQAHVLFQTGFSLRPLRYPGEGNPQSPDAGYFRYTLGEDGLVIGSLAVPEQREGREIPPFPLAELSGFLAAWESQDPDGTGRAAFSPPPAPADLASPLLALLLLFPPLTGRYGGWKKINPYYDKRIAA